MSEEQNEFIYEDKPNPESQPPAQARIVSPTRGFYWLEKSLSDILAPYFSQWFLAGLLYAVIVTVGQLIHPYIEVVVNLLGPFFIAGGILGAHAIKQSNQAPTRGQFFSAFTHPSKMNIILLIGVQLLLAAIFVYSMLNAIGVETLQSIDWEKFQAQEDQAYMQQVVQQLFPFIKWMLLFIFLYTLLFWFVMPLIVFEGQFTFKALTQSFIASVKNIGAILVFIIIVIVTLLALGLVLSLVMAVISAVAPQLVSLIVSVIMTAIFMPIASGIVYISYREVFYGEVEASNKRL